MELFGGISQTWRISHLQMESAHRERKLFCCTANTCKTSEQLGEIRSFWLHKTQQSLREQEVRMTLGFLAVTLEGKCLQDSSGRPARWLSR